MNTEKILEITSIQPKYQSKVNAFVKNDRKYNNLVNMGLDEGIQGRHVYDKALGLWEDLPSNEQKNLLKLYKNFYGYECISLSYY